MQHQLVRRGVQLAPPTVEDDESGAQVLVPLRHQTTPEVGRQLLAVPARPRRVHRSGAREGLGRRHRRDCPAPGCEVGMRSSAWRQFVAARCIPTPAGRGKEDVPPFDDARRVTTFGGVVMKLRRSIALSVAAGAAILMAAPSAASAAPSAPAPDRYPEPGRRPDRERQRPVRRQPVRLRHRHPGGPRGRRGQARQPGGPAHQGRRRADGVPAAGLRLPRPRPAADRHVVRERAGRLQRRSSPAAGIDTIETVLLYHVVPGATITSKDAVNADGAQLTTAQGGTITVDVIVKWLGLVKLVDQDPDRREPLPEPVRARHQQGQQADRARDHRRPAPGRPALTGRLASASP